MDFALIVDEYNVGVAAFVTAVQSVSPRYERTGKVKRVLEFADSGQAA